MLIDGIAQIQFGGAPPNSSVRTLRQYQLQIHTLWSQLLSLVSQKLSMENHGRDGSYRATRIGGLAIHIVNLDLKLC